MSDTVLDLIDGSIAAYGDAMRWTPDPTPDLDTTDLVDPAWLASVGEGFNRLACYLSDAVAKLSAAQVVREGEAAVLRGGVDPRTPPVFLGVHR